MFDQVIMDWTGSQVSGVVMGLLGPEVSQDLQPSDRKVTEPSMENSNDLLLVSKSWMCSPQGLQEIRELLVPKVRLTCWLECVRDSILHLSMTFVSSLGSPGVPGSPGQYLFSRESHWFARIHLTHSLFSSGQPGSQGFRGEPGSLGPKGQLRFTRLPGFSWILFNHQLHSGFSNCCLTFL